MEKDPSTLLFFAPGREFVEPYVCRELSGWRIVALDADSLSTAALPAAEAAVMLSGTEVYDVPDGGADNFDESAPTTSGSPLLNMERDFVNACVGAGLRPVILRCANTVGTGMTGLPMRLARWIYRGLFFHFPGNEARISAVHACDVAACVAAAANLPKDDANPLILNLTDGENPTIHDFCEALAYRLSQKRISSLSTRPQQWVAAVIYGKKRMKLLTTTVTFNSQAARNILKTEPVKVTEYLKSHIYDNSSL